MTKKYLINYGGSLETPKLVNLKEDQIINFEINAYMGDDNSAFLLNLDTNNIYDKDDVKINGLSDYNISVIPGDGIFVKRDGSLKIDGFKHKRCNGCTTFLNKKNNVYKKDEETINEKPYYPLDVDRFKICKIDKTTKLVPIRLVGKVNKIDHLTKYVDVHISDFYELTNLC